jgi:hypothetical protein
MPEHFGDLAVRPFNPTYGDEELLLPEREITKSMDLFPVIISENPEF